MFKVEKPGIAYLENISEKEVLLKEYESENKVLDVNGHLHTPYSYCSFDNIRQIFEMAANENIVLLGINDFFTTNGYGEFFNNSREFGIFPLFNIEFMGLVEEYQQNDIRVNDPGNPGRIYFSGKGLDFPVNLSDEKQALLQKVVDASQQQMKEMLEKASGLLSSIEPDLELDYEELMRKYAKDILRERHIATAIRIKVAERHEGHAAQMAFYNLLFDGAPLQSDVNNIAALENEIRSKLLKKGGRAFVPESSEAFPPLNEIINLILDAGGIPCYPVLLDGANGKYTEFEGDWEKMHKELRKYNVKCIELIPSRNTVAELEKFVRFFNERNYVITFGTEHNSPGVFPIEVKVEKDQTLTDWLREISYKGCCVIAAHQYLRANGKPGFVDENGTCDSDNIQQYHELGNAVIKEFISSKK